MNPNYFGKNTIKYEYKKICEEKHCSNILKNQKRKH